jgi:hypothetical protein
MKIKKRLNITIEVDLDEYSAEYGDAVETPAEQAAAMDHAQAMVLEAAVAQLQPHNHWAKIATRRVIAQ